MDELLALNPYSPEAAQIISDRFSGYRISDVIKTVIMAEPEGEYEHLFRNLPGDQQESALFRQTNLTADISQRLKDYCGKQTREYWNSPKDLRYDLLFKLAFGTVDVQDVELRYSQGQRREIKLLIFDILEKKEQSDSLSTFFPKAVFAVLSSILLFFTVFIFLNKQSSRSSPALPDAGLRQIVQEQAQGQGLPVRLKIPNIKVDTAIEFVGITSKGEMGIPSNAVDVGWFKLGPRPGEKGSAVIAGHFSGQNGEAGVFTNLDKIRVGDKLYVEDNQGGTNSFVVREIRAYDPGYAEEVFSSNDIAHLNLITCDGAWDKEKGTYSKRLVVFADLIQSK